MLARLGQVLYWIGNGLTLLSMALIVYLLMYGNENYKLGITIFAVFGVLSWIAGRACKYVLAGE